MTSNQEIGHEKARIVVGTGLLLTLGTAVAGTLMYGQGSSAARDRTRREHASRRTAVTPEMIADVEGDRELVRLHRAESADLSRDVGA